MSDLILRAATPRIRNPGSSGDDDSLEMTTDATPHTASSEVDGTKFEGSMVRIYAAGGNVYLAAGKEGTVQNPNAPSSDGGSGSNFGFRVKDGESEDVYIEPNRGWFKHVGNAASVEIIIKKV